MKRVLGWHHLVDRLVHAAIAVFSLTVAFLLRFDFSLPPEIRRLYLAGLALALLIKPVVFHFAGFHKGWRQYFEPSDIARLVAGNLAASIFFAASAVAFLGPQFPRSVFLIDFGLTLLLTGGLRFAGAFLRELMRAGRSQPHNRRILIHGMEEAAMALLREIRSNPASEYEVVGFLDDNPANSHERLMGMPVLGTNRQAAVIVDQMKTAGKPIDEIVIARASGTDRNLAEVLANCRSSGVPCKILPPLTEILNARSVTSKIRNVSLNDLLGRDPVQLEKDRIHSSIAGRSVLVTGAAGSIGSEICRQILKYGPTRLVAFDQAESPLYELECELRRLGNGTEWVSKLGDTRSFETLNETIRQHGIDSVFHAAAYKHVPMLEEHAVVGVHNNIFGTWNLVRAASQNGVRNLLMISTDKAVNPTSVMGASKRVCELIVSSLETSGFDMVPSCVSVRFGNVLGSNGSVVPLFQAQIDGGGPVTVTHPEMRRYFMTIPEAVMLVLQASVMGSGSKIFVLDMGRQMRIVDLAENMIYAAGLVPNKDIEIHFTGVRPGEKLYEELGLASERTLPTYHERIKIFEDPVQSWNSIAEWVADLDGILRSRQAQEVVSHLQKLVPEFQPDSKWLRDPEDSSDLVPGLISAHSA